MLGLGLGIGAVQAAPLARYSIGGKAPAVVADTVAGVYGLGGRSVGFDRLFSFSRLSAAWKLNALGHWVKVLAGEPRIGHHVWKGGKLVPAGIAVCSEVRTNHVTLSTRFETGWSGTDVDVTPNTHMAPDGTISADTLTRVGETLGYLIKSAIGVNGKTKSIYARTVSGTGTVGLLSHNSVPASEMALTEEWQEFDLPVDTAETGGSNFYAVDFRVGDLTEVVVWMAQLKDGPYINDLIPTDVSTVSVAAESLETDPVKLAKAVGVFGPELIDSENWVDSSDAGGGTSASEDTLTLDNVTGTARIFSSIALEAGELYMLEHTRSGGEVRAYQGPGVSLGVVETGATTQLFIADPAADSISYRNFTAGTTGQVSGVSLRKVTMPEALTFVMKGTKSYEDEGLNPQVRMMLWQADSSNRIRLQLNTVDARTGQFIAFTQKDGVANSALSASDAYSPGVEVPFSVAAVLTATEIEGFYSGVSTGKVTHGGLPNLLASPIELFPNGTGTIEQFAIYVGNPGAAALLEATS